MSNTEEWRDIPGYEGYYQASSHGRIRSLDREVTQMHPSGKGMMTRLWRGRVLTFGPYSGERYRVGLSRDGVLEMKGVAVLVALAFHGLPPEGKGHALHRDGDMYNNVPENLYWGDARDNVQDTIRHGRHRGVTKTHCPHGHALDGKNLYINVTLQSRACKACRVANAWGYARKRRGVETSIEERRAYADKRYAEIMAEE
ncbi:HNH endonuclease [Mycobacterium phage ThreeRngTarjay]|uniref:HNH endonuclease n=1 Tax=Mycobacterium phage Wanda TaxID=1340713 RepID=UPI0003880ABB|nr:HNH endonuclease [Mycobacterium phage Wanda]YP_009124101.1 HNH endonuclease [Mycobacterium phage Minerva]AYB69627.1 HNH endonuclease [Mycobacterium phage Kalah2]QBI97592.1 HNH endonuclease [Mycobacterium phage Hughesyang]QBI98769.1 HNH endonuclease [Mycobacterium phage Bobby]QBI99772.1 HNH endonuclease [Mycobacterium phage ThreeRngTarjay]QBJ00096.1 HNH endonuclease [Mycobacterium phage Phoebus]